MKNYLQKHSLKIISITSFVLILIPIIVFLLFFGKKDVSQDLSVWASFGDYIGGTVNTVLSLISLIILGYLTKILNNQSNEENKKINVLLKRYDSYDKLSSYLTDIETVHIKLRIDLDKVYSTKDNTLKELYFNKMEERVNIYFDLLALLKTFPYRFGHLFKYDFNSNNYYDLVSNAEAVKELFKKVIRETDDDDSKIDRDEFINDYEKLYQNFHSFLEDLAKELK